MVKLACVNIDKLYRFNRCLSEGQALKFLKNCIHSPHIRVVGYSNDSPYHNTDIEILYAKQIQDIIQYIPFILTLPLYRRNEK